ncbi:inositol-trisphosphate 3-kinase B-like [Protobothrops mucrosquamatus]|uniref:inositol-trisphosphate 3-kinase B-like n=1 Tax=Protobothrops mucrosquamatus TaxID=103944 RepID=UPI000775F6EF|nr:inositol-trisphosphate 3-kinase B-like [Protobothrops mucrosquamatus]
MTDADQGFSDGQDCHEGASRGCCNDPVDCDACWETVTNDVDQGFSNSWGCHVTSGVLGSLMPDDDMDCHTTKSWKTFFTMVHWSLRRRSSWVQLAGHEGNFKPSEGGLILKKFSAVEEACLSELMTDVLRPFVPAYHGVAEVGEERYIQMDDLLLGLQNPSIMDCKMGTRTYLEDEVGKSHPRSAPRRDLYQKMVKIDPWAPTPEEHSQGAITKPRYMQWRESTSSSTSLGFRIEGVTIEGGAVQRDFKQTRSQDQIMEIFLQFVKNRVDVLVSS